METVEPHRGVLDPIQLGSFAQRPDAAKHVYALLGLLKEGAPTTYRHCAHVALYGVRIRRGTRSLEEAENVLAVVEQANHALGIRGCSPSIPAV